MWSDEERIVSPDSRSLVPLADLTDADGTVWQ